MLENKRRQYLSTYLIVYISFIFAIAVGYGLYGYGHDYYTAYQGSNLKWGGFFSRLGFMIATLTINEVHLGVQIVTFLLALSSGFLIREHVKFKDSYSLIFFITLYLIAIHTWPIIMSTSNAMRQGLAMSFIFFALVANSRKNYYWMIFFSICAIFMHRSGLFLSLVITFSTIINYFFGNLSHGKKAILYFSVGLILFLFANFVLRYIGLLVYSGDEGSRIIGGDFRWAFLSISFIYIILTFLYRNMLDNPFNLSVYYFSFISLSFLTSGLNWEYERIGMMMLFPYILSFGILLNRSSYKIYLILSFIALLYLTIFMGMYAALN
tara:strand:- start:700 stop:1671 length:972 start_codon:yes stop_codon:yes gene_type:complete